MESRCRSARRKSRRDAKPEAGPTAKPPDFVPIRRRGSRVSPRTRESSCYPHYQDGIRGAGMDTKAWYQRMLKTSEWKAKRKEIYERDGHTCVDCGSHRGVIHCHHLYYVK